jgi:hypothetical protein
MLAKRVNGEGAQEGSQRISWYRLKDLWLGFSIDDLNGDSLNLYTNHVFGSRSSVTTGPACTLGQQRAPTCTTVQEGKCLVRTKRSDSVAVVVTH